MTRTSSLGKSGKSGGNRGQTERIPPILRRPAGGIYLTENRENRGTDGTNPIHSADNRQAAFTARNKTFVLFAPRVRAAQGPSSDQAHPFATSPQQPKNASAGDPDRERY